MYLYFSEARMFKRIFVVLLVAQLGTLVASYGRFSPEGVSSESPKIKIGDIKTLAQANAGIARIENKIQKIPQKDKKRLQELQSRLTKVKAKRKVIEDEEESKKAAIAQLQKAIKAQQDREEAQGKASREAEETKRQQRVEKERVAKEAAKSARRVKKTDSRSS